MKCRCKLVITTKIQRSSCAPGGLQQETITSVEDHPWGPKLGVEGRPSLELTFLNVAGAAGHGFETLPAAAAEREHEKESKDFEDHTDRAEQGAHGN